MPYANKKPALAALLALALAACGEQEQHQMPPPDVRARLTALIERLAQHPELWPPAATRP